MFFFIVFNPALLSIFGNIASMSQVTNSVPGGKERVWLISFILFKKCVVSLIYDGCLRASGAK